MSDGQHPSRVSCEWAVKGGKDSGVLDDVETKMPLCTSISNTLLPEGRVQTGLSSAADAQWRLVCWGQPKCSPGFLAHLCTDRVFPPPL